jgi:hypothetical protein
MVLDGGTPDEWYVSAALDLAGKQHLPHPKLYHKEMGIQIPNLPRSRCRKNKQTESSK